MSSLLPLGIAAFAASLGGPFLAFKFVNGSMAEPHGRGELPGTGSAVGRSVVVRCENSL